MGLFCKRHLSLLRQTEPKALGRPDAEIHWPALMCHKDVRPCIRALSDRLVYCQYNFHCRRSALIRHSFGDLHYTLLD